VTVPVTAAVDPTAPATQPSTDAAYQAAAAQIAAIG
jgi:hypothetical protein